MLLMENISKVNCGPSNEVFVDQQLKSSNKFQQQNDYHIHQHQQYCQNELYQQHQQQHCLPQQPPSQQLPTQQKQQLNLKQRSPQQNSSPNQQPTFQNSDNIQLDLQLLKNVGEYDDKKSFNNSTTDKDEACNNNEATRVNINLKQICLNDANINNVNNNNNNINNNNNKSSNNNINNNNTENKIIYNTSHTNSGNNITINNSNQNSNEPNFENNLADNCCDKSGNILLDIKTNTSSIKIVDKCCGEQSNTAIGDEYHTNNDDVDRRDHNNNINKDMDINQITTTTPTTTSTTIRGFDYKHKLILAKNSLTNCNSPVSALDNFQSELSKVDSNQLTSLSKSQSSTPESKTQDLSPMISSKLTFDKTDNDLINSFSERKTNPELKHFQAKEISNAYSADEETTENSQNYSRRNNASDSELPTYLAQGQTFQFGVERKISNDYKCKEENDDEENGNGASDYDDEDDNVVEDGDEDIDDQFNPMDRKLPDLLLQHTPGFDPLKPNHHHLYNNHYLQRVYESYKQFSDPTRKVESTKNSFESPFVGQQIRQPHQQQHFSTNPLVNMWQQYNHQIGNNNNGNISSNGFLFSDNNKSDNIGLINPSSQQSPFRDSSNNDSNKINDGNESESSSASNKKNVFCCHICSFVGTSEDDFNSHMTQHFEHQCPHCTYSSRTEGRLKRHIKDFHSNEDSIYTGQHKVKSSAPKRTCRYCKFYTYDQVEFWLHLKKHIKPEKLLECPHCEFVTELKHHLEYHIRVHIGSKPFKCPKCNYSCVNKSMLNSHMKSHTNVYQFRCRDCNYATKYSHSLKLHLIKKKHHADVVLNSDGSMPTDGTGHFDSVNRRGPPRGPRTIKGSKRIDTAFALRQHLANPFKFLADPRLSHYAQKPNIEDSFWNDSHPNRSISPSETSTTSKDDHYSFNESLENIHKPTFLPSLPSLYSSSSLGLPPRSPISLPLKFFDCSFCLEKFSTPMSLKCHVEEYHYRELMLFKFKQSKPASQPNIENGQVKQEEEIFPEATKTEEPEDPPPATGNAVVLDLSNGAKRKLDEDKDSGHADSPSSVHSFSDSLVKKRSRKGRAFKVQTETLEDQMTKSNNKTKDDEESDDTRICSQDEINTNEKSPTIDKNDQIEKDEDKKSSTPSSTSLTSSTQNCRLKVDSSWHLCRHCEMAFADQMTHRLHMGYHGYFNPFQCNGCGENCVDAFDFMLHLMCKAHN